MFGLCWVVFIFYFYLLNSYSLSQILYSFFVWHQFSSLVFVLFFIFIFWLKIHHHTRKTTITTKPIYTTHSHTHYPCLPPPNPNPPPTTYLHHHQPQIHHPHSHKFETIATTTSISSHPYANRFKTHTKSKSTTHIHLHNQYSPPPPFIKDPLVLAPTNFEIFFKMSLYSFLVNMKTVKMCINFLYSNSLCWILK